MTQSPSDQNTAQDRTSAEAITPVDWRSAMGAFTAGVTVVTVADQDGEFGTTVSAFSSVSLEPPLLLICMDTGSRTCQKIESAQRFGVNILAEGQGDLAYRFASSKIENKFEGVAYRLGHNGLPLLEGGMASIECELTQSIDGGDHRILLGRPLSIRIQPDAQPLVYVRGKFHDLGPAVV